MSNWNSDGLGHKRAGPLHNPIPPDLWGEADCPDCGGDIIDEGDWVTCDTCDWAIDRGY